MQVRQKRHESLMHLKAEVGDYRDSLIQSRKNAEETLLQQKAEEAEV